MRITVCEIGFAEPVAANQNIKRCTFPRSVSNSFDDEFSSIGDLTSRLLCRLSGKMVEGDFARLPSTLPHLRGDY